MHEKPWWSLYSKLASMLVCRRIWRVYMELWGVFVTIWCWNRKLFKNTDHPSLFHCNKICRVPRKIFDARPSGLVFKQLPQDPANVNAWKTMGDLNIESTLLKYYVSRHTKRWNMYISNLWQWKMAFGKPIGYILAVSICMPYHQNIPVAIHANWPWTGSRPQFAYGSCNFDEASHRFQDLRPLQFWPQLSLGHWKIVLDKPLANIIYMQKIIKVFPSAQELWRMLLASEKNFDISFANSFGLIMSLTIQELCHFRWPRTNGWKDGQVDYKAHLGNQSVYISAGRAIFGILFKLNGNVCPHALSKKSERTYS